MISFEYPAVVALGLVVPAIALVRHGAGKRRPRRLVLPLDSWGGARSGDAGTFWRFLYALSSLLFGAAWIALAAAAAGPASVSSKGLITNSGLDVVFAVDASPSMAARDLEPSRLDAAKSFIRSYVESPEGAAGAAVGLVAFGAEAALACPPTSDYAIVLERLNLIKPGLLGDGTALGQGLGSALRQVAASDAPAAVVVLLSDGEDNVGLVHPVDAARALERHGAGLLVIGLGSTGDVPIDYVDPATGQRMSGAYRSGFDDEALAALAFAGGGEYRSVTDGRALGALFKDLGTLGKASAERRHTPGAVGAQDRASFGAAKRPLGSFLFLLAMAFAAAGWLIRRLGFGGLA